MRKILPRCGVNHFVWFMLALLLILGSCQKDFELSRDVLIERGEEARLSEKFRAYQRHFVQEYQRTQEARTLSLKAGNVATLVDLEPVWIAGQTIATDSLRKEVYIVPIKVGQMVLRISETIDSVLLKERPEMFTRVLMTGYRDLERNTISPNRLIHYVPSERFVTAGGQFSTTLSEVPEGYDGAIDVYNLAGQLLYTVVYLEGKMRDLFIAVPDQVESIPSPHGQDTLSQARSYPGRYRSEFGDSDRDEFLMVAALAHHVGMSCLRYLIGTIRDAVDAEHEYFFRRTTPDYSRTYKQLHYEIGEGMAGNRPDLGKEFGILLSPLIIEVKDAYASRHRVVGSFGNRNAVVNLDCLNYRRLYGPWMDNYERVIDNPYHTYPPRMIFDMLADRMFFHNYFLVETALDYLADLHGIGFDSIDRHRPTSSVLGGSPSPSSSSSAVAGGWYTSSPPPPPDPAREEYLRQEYYILMPMLDGEIDQQFDDPGLKPLLDTLQARLISLSLPPQNLVHKITWYLSDRYTWNDKGKPFLKAIKFDFSGNGHMSVNTKGELTIRTDDILSIDELSVEHEWIHLCQFKMRREMGHTVSLKDGRMGCMEFERALIQDVENYRRMRQAQKAGNTEEVKRRSLYYRWAILDPEKGTFKKELEDYLDWIKLLTNDGKEAPNLDKIGGYEEFKKWFFKEITTFTMVHKGFANALKDVPTDEQGNKLYDYEPIVFAEIFQLP